MKHTTSRRSRNLGIGWSNQPRQTPKGLIIEEPAAPNSQGGIRSCWKELKKCRHINSGNDCVVRLFVRGKKAIKATNNMGWPLMRFGYIDITEVLAIMELGQEVIIETEDNYEDRLV